MQTLRTRVIARETGHARKILKDSAPMRAIGALESSACENAKVKCHKSVREHPSPVADAATVEGAEIIPICRTPGSRIVGEMSLEIGRAY
jgi:hypothetical protein